MAECKACGEWFGTSCEEDLCQVCQRALDRLKGYAAPVVHGRWIEDGSTQICSVCGEEHECENYRAPYCDTCGAKMDKGDNRE